MRETKERSLFIPAIFLSAFVVTCLGYVFVFSPVVVCNLCFGIGTMTREEHRDVVDFLRIEGELPREWKCDWCAGRGKVTPRRKWTVSLPSHFRMTEGDKKAILRLLEKRREPE